MLMEAMSLDEYMSLLKEIKEKHSRPGITAQPLMCIKYVNGTVDMRDGKCFNLKIRPWFGTEMFLDYRDGHVFGGTAATATSEVHDMTFYQYILKVIRREIVPFLNPLSNGQDK